MNSSRASSTCRLEWRRSRWLQVALVALALAAIASPWLSAAPGWACIAANVVVAAYAGWVLRASDEACTLSWAGGDAPWHVEHVGGTESLRHVAATFRGGLVVLTLADAQGRRRRYAWWPDTLDAPGRRALRLALQLRVPPATPTQPALGGAS